MKTYNFLPVENHQLISDQLYQYVVDRTNILEVTRDFGCWTYLQVDSVLTDIPELAIELAKIVDHPITLIAVLSYPPGSNIPVHIDVGLYKHRILWPVANCTGSYTKFYNQNGNKLIKKFSTTGGAYITHEKIHPLIEIDSCELLAPAVINTQVLHSVVANPTATGHRLSATFGFGKADLGDLFDKED
jgi:hypothetical protein